MDNGIHSGSNPASHCLYKADQLFYDDAYSIRKLDSAGLVFDISKALVSCPPETLPSIGECGKTEVRIPFRLTWQM